jgi:hypothetical protein
MLLLRVKVHSVSEEDGFLSSSQATVITTQIYSVMRYGLLDRRSASMHSEPEHSIDIMFRTRKFGEKDNIWIVEAHDFKIKSAVSPNMDTGTPY